MSLAREVEKWRAQGSAGEVAGRRSDFWRRGGCVRRKWGEISNSFGFALQITNYEYRHLNIHLIWPNIFIEMKSKGSGSIDGPKYGFSLFEGCLHYGWGRYHIFTPPWKKYTHEKQVFGVDERWHPDSPKDEFDQSLRYQSVQKWSRWFNGDHQEGKALVTVERRRWTPKWRAWFSRSRWKYWIDVTFSREVGPESGSWKGGTIGCGYEIKKGETPEECFRRMMRNRKFGRN